jgi:hypothetical protein
VWVTIVFSCCCSSSALLVILISPAPRNGVASRGITPGKKVKHKQCALTPDVSSHITIPTPPHPFLFVFDASPAFICVLQPSSFFSCFFYHQYLPLPPPLSYRSGSPTTPPHPPFVAVWRCFFQVVVVVMVVAACVQAAKRRESQI